MKPRDLSDLFLYIPTEIKTLTNQAIDLEWEGHDASHIWQEVDRLNFKLKHEGQYYDPLW